MVSLIRFSFLAVLLIVTGCASVQTQQAKYETGKFPETGERTNVSVGQVMISKYDYLAQSIATLRDPVLGSFWMGRQGLMAGTKLIGAISSGEVVYC